MRTLRSEMQGVGAAPANIRTEVAAPHQGYDNADKVAEPDRQARGSPRSHAADDVEDESGKARKRRRTDVPTNTEIREGRQPNRRQPAAADRPGAERAGAVLLRGRPANVGEAADRRRGAVAGICD